MGRTGGGIRQYGAGRRHPRGGGQSGSRVLFGLCDHVEALVSVLGKRDLQYPLTARDIAEGVTALSGPADDTVPESATASVDLGDVGRHLGIPKVDIRIDTVNIYVTIASPGWRRGRLVDHRSAAVAG